ncbi:hypothetical protein [Nocardia sp. NBC_01009]|uniref:hypothetical protein n=1 Tax=Nocardia sp. NBC_01009 TaxID=2975996 RepID=UPI00386F9A31|nr:hypothetical protein OHA42_08145 [Nocardia sp. NBC_01009]
MSEINEDTHRARRRAVRSAGPPVEEAGTGESAAAAGSTSEVAKGFSARAVALGAAAGPEGTATAGVASTSAASGVPDAEPTPVEGSRVDLGKSRAETAKDADEPGDSGPNEETKAGGGRTRILAAAACALLAVAAVIGAGWSVIAMKSVDDRDARRTEYTQTARQAILNLTTIRADSAKEDIDRILSVASGQFKTEFDGRVDPFLNIVKEAKVVSNGEIVEAAVESDDEGSAKILVAAKQTLTNAGQAEPQTRFYRFRVTVTRNDSGLSASNVEFVG